MRVTEQQAIMAVADECRRNFFYFVKLFWSTIITEKPVYNWHIPYLCHELEKISYPIFKREPKLYDLIINIPPATTKSTIVTIMYPVWLWTNDPTVRIITNSYSGTLSIDHATKSKDIISSDRFKLLFPEIEIRRDKSGKQNYENTKTGYRYATSTGATITGFHGHVIINDDPINPKQAESEPMRYMANEHTKTLSSRKVDKAITPTITIMQRLHQEDVTGFLLSHKGDKIKHINLPAEECEDVMPAELRQNYIDGLLDPVRLSKDILEEAKIDLGSRAYAGQYMQSPTVAGGNIVKQEWFKRISQEEFNALRFKETIHSFLDTAYEEKKHGADNDPSGILDACKIRGNIYITNAAKWYKTFPDLIKILPEWMHSNGHSNLSTLRIEPKANGISVVQTLETMTNINVARTPPPTTSKAERLHAISPKIECGRVWLVEGEWNEEFLDEVCGFPSRKHDEFVDILGYAINYLDSEDWELPANVDNLF